MVDTLTKKSRFAYSIIVSIFILLFSITFFLINSERFSAEQINISGKQRMLVQRIALLSNLYYYSPSSEKIKDKIETSLDSFMQNHNLIKDIKNQKIDEILYSQRYQYDDLTQNYKKNVELFLKNNDIQHLKIINYTNESLLNTADTFAEIIIITFSKKIEIFISIVLFLSFFFIATIYFVYKNITLTSIAKIEEYVEKLETSHRFINSILDNSAHAIISTTVDGVITSFNKQAEFLLGYKKEELIDKHSPAIFHQKEQVVQRAKELSKELNRTIEPGFDVFVEKAKNGLKYIDEWIYVTKDQKELDVRLSITELIDSNGEINGFLGIAEDITEFKQKEMENLNYLNLINKNIITSSTDLRGIITYVSDAFCVISGFKKSELIGESHSLIKHEDMPPEIYKDLWQTIVADEIWRGELKNRRKDGTYYWVEATISPTYDYYGKKIGYTAIRQDITDKKIIEQLSITDGLTNLYNRRYFNDISQREIEKAKRDKNYFAFILLDIDNFKKYNDTYGHQAGDLVLVNIGKTLKNSFKRSQDIVFRIGGEEFCVVISGKNVDELKEIINNAKNNIQNLNIEHELNIPYKVVTSSFGVVIVFVNSFEQTYSIENIYKDADILLYEAKESGRNKVIFKEI